MLADAGHDRVLGLEAAGNADQVLRQPRPVSSSRIDRASRAGYGRIDLADIGRSAAALEVAITGSGH
jgi:hypothetical protein